MTFVTHKFKLNSSTVDELQNMKPNFGFNGFGEFIFYRTYSRVKDDGSQESWADCIIRVVEGVFSIRKDWYIKNGILWDDSVWQVYARPFAISMFKMEWLPPGRGLWAMGTDFVYERGSMALNNCGFTTIGSNIGRDINWLMDALMCGVGVGFLPEPDDELQVYSPIGEYTYVIPDTREGWCLATEALINSYLSPHSKKPIFDYSEIRPSGLPIKGFGGISSGPEPLMKFHKEIEQFMAMYQANDWYNAVFLKADIANCAGCCVVAGNVRRSAELLAGDFDDIMELKDYQKHAYREAHGWMSNNSVFLRTAEDFLRLNEIAERVRTNGEPGYINLCTLPYGRIGKDMGNLKMDKAIGFNPCGEQPLEDKELCTLVETCPTRCETTKQWLKACEYATLYASTVTLLPTHRSETNAVMLRNRRIGVGIIDISLWKEEIGTTQLISALRAGYKKVRQTNSWMNNEAGVPEAIRVTTIKPGGTTPKLPGLRSGWQNPTFGLTLRRVRVAQNSPVYNILIEANIPHEPDVFSKNTEVFEFAVDQSANGRVKAATEISLHAQAMMLVLLQREWSDNAVSNTLYFRPKYNYIKDVNLGATPDLEEVPLELFNGAEDDLKESLIKDTEYFSESLSQKFELVYDDFSHNWHLKVYQYDKNHEEDLIEDVLASIAPLTKSVSLLPHSSVGAYRQMPEEGLSAEEYEKRLAAMKPIDWSKLRGSDGLDEKFCEGPNCEVAFVKANSTN